MRLLISALLVVLPGIATAQTQDDIVVRDHRRVERKAIETYVINISVRSAGQLARFHQPICPVVLGLPRPHSTTVEKRIIADAVAAGAPISKNARCSANLIVVIAENGGNLVKDIGIRRQGWLDGLSPSELRALIASAPARGWTVSSLRNEDGAVMPQQDRRGERDPSNPYPSGRVIFPSIIKESTRADTEASFVVLDKAATVGLTLRQIADYAAMRGLARTKPPRPGGAIDTILTVFDPAAAPVRELTRTDAAYLRALYASDGRNAAVIERNAITRRLARGE